jgi:hypothetical protein
MATRTRLSITLYVGLKLPLLFVDLFDQHYTKAQVMTHDAEKHMLT